QLAQGLLFENYPVYAPLFFGDAVTLGDYFGKNDVVIELNRENARQEWDQIFTQWRDEFESEADRNDSPIVLPGPEKIATASLQTGSEHTLVVEALDIAIDLDDKIKNDIHL